MTPRAPLHTTALMVVLAVVLASASFAYRFNTLGGAFAGFENDHFAQLIRATAMLDGEQPIRDFSDVELRAIWPAPAYSVSALAQKFLGRSLRSEAVLTIGMLSIGAAMLFWLSVRFGGGAILQALVLTLLAVALRPALYNYPKIIVYLLGITAMTSYARRPTTTRAVMLGVAAVIGGLYRHDHGVLLAIAAAALLALMHGRDALRPLLIVAGTCVIALLPGVAFAQAHGGFISYLRECIALSTQEASRTVESGFHFDVDRTQKLLARAPLPEPPKPRIAVRWSPDVSGVDRVRAEADLHLIDPVRRADDFNWSYIVDAPSTDRLAAIVRDARVVDTDGIDRSTFVLTAAPPPQPPRWRQELARWRIAPGVFRDDNAAPWLYLVAWSVVVIAAICAWLPVARSTLPPDLPLALLRATSVLAMLMLIVLLRNPNPLRMADVSVPVTILGTWLLAAMLRAARAWSRPARWAVAIAIVIVLGVSTAAVADVGETLPQLNAGGFGTFERARRQSADVWRTLGALPGSLEGIDDTLANAAAYLRRCTRPTDRLFIADSLPEVYYFAERRFASGQFAYFSNFYSSAEQQRQAIERWRAQAVPIALVQGAPRFDQEFASDYPLLTDYLRSRYRKTGSLAVERGATMDVWVDTSIGASTDRETRLPCVQ